MNEQHLMWNLENIELYKLLANYSETQEWYESFDNFFRKNRKSKKNCRIQYRQKYIARTKNGKFFIPVTRYYDGITNKTFNCQFQTNFIFSKINELKALCQQLFYENVTQTRISSITKNSYCQRTISNIVKKKSIFVKQY